MKVCYFDTETTGVNPKENGLIQLAAIVEIDGEVKGAESWNIAPFLVDRIEDKALEVNGKTKKEIFAYTAPDLMIAKVKAFFARFVDPYDKSDKFTPAGYNVSFDIEFLREWFFKCGDKYGYGSWMNYNAVDPLPLVRWLRFAGVLNLPDYKLGTVCDHFGIALGSDAHDALADVRATRNLVRLLNDRYFGNKEGARPTLAGE